MTTRRNMIKAGAGLAAILASGKAPAYLIKSMLAARNSIGMRVGGAKLPYDVEEVEYLESTGTQWIDTGIIPTIDTICDIDCMSITFVGWGGIVGSCTSDNSADSYYFRQSGAVSVKGYSATVDGKSNVNQILVDDGVKASCHLSKDTFEVNGTIKTLGATAFSVSPSLPMFMFAVNLGGSPWIYRLFKGRVFSCKIYNGNILVRDFIPVRFTNELGHSEGAMYDRVSGELEPFRNKGTGAFLWGPDASAQNGGGIT